MPEDLQSIKSLLTCASPAEFIRRIRERGLDTLTGREYRRALRHHRSKIPAARAAQVEACTALREAHNTFAQSAPKDSTALLRALTTLAERQQAFDNATADLKQAEALTQFNAARLRVYEHFAARPASCGPNALLESRADEALAAARDAIHHRALAEAGKQTARVLRCVPIASGV